MTTEQISEFLVTLLFSPVGASETISLYLCKTKQDEKYSLCVI